MKNFFKNKANNIEKLINQDKGITIALTSLIILFFYNFTRLKMVNFDHLAFNNFNFLGSIKRMYVYLVMEQARPSFVAVLGNAVEYLLVDHYWIWTILFIFVASYLVGKILFEITENIFVGLFGFTLSVCLSTISLEPISLPSAYAFSSGFGIWMVLAAVLYTLRFNKTKKYIYKVVATICILLCMFDYELGIVYLPVLIAINCYYLKSLKIKENIKVSKEFILAGILYLIAYFIVKSTFIGSYGGTQLNNVFEPLKIIYTWLFMLVATIPGFFFLFNKSNAYQTPLNYISNYGNNSFGALDIAKNYISLSLILQVILFIYLICKLFIHYKSVTQTNLIPKKQSKVKMEGIWKIFLLMLIVYTIIMPMLPSSLTAYTQNQVSVRWRLIGICNHYSYFFLILGICLLGYYKLSKIMHKKVILGCLLLVLTMQFSFVAFTNIQNSQFINIAGNRFEQFDNIINDISNTVGDNGVIYSPSLFSSASPLSVPNFYFTNRIKYITGYNINLTNDLSAIQNDEIYYLRYMYSSDNNNAIFVLSKVTINQLKSLQHDQTYSIDNILSTNNAYVYVFSELKDFWLIGRTNNSNNQTITVDYNGDNSTLSTPDVFQYEIKQNQKVSGIPKKLVFSGNNINPNSIAILPVYLAAQYNSEKIDLSAKEVGPTLATAEVIKGFYPDNWAESESEFNILSGEEGKMILKFYTPQIFNDFKINILINNEEKEVVNITDNYQITTIDVPQNQKLNLKFVSNGNFKSSDGRTLSYIISDIICN